MRGCFFISNPTAFLLLWQSVRAIWVQMSSSGSTSAPATDGRRHCSSIPLVRGSTLPTVLTELLFSLPRLKTTIVQEKPGQYTNYLFSVCFAILTSESMIGTSVSTPTVVANAAPLCNPNRLIATATASSKKLEAPIIPAGAAIS